MRPTSISTSTSTCISTSVSTSTPISTCISTSTPTSTAISTSTPTSTSISTCTSISISTGTCTGTLGDLRAAVDVFAEALGGDAGHGVVEIVVEELAPLHQHVRVVLVGRHLVGGDDARRHQPRRRLRETVVLDATRPSCVGRRNPVKKKTLKPGHPQVSSGLRTLADVPMGRLKPFS